MGYWTYAHPNPGQQSFSVPVSGQSDGKTEVKPGQLRGGATVNFEVKHCDVGSKTVTCSLSVVSPRYDRKLVVSSYYTHLIDSEGDSFAMTSEMIRLDLDRNQKLAFKLAFRVNKDVVRPLTLKMVGDLGSDRLDTSFEIK